MNKCSQPVNWVQSITVHNRTIEYSQKLYNTVNRQLNTVNKCTQLDNWLRSGSGCNGKTEYSQLLYTAGQSNTVSKWPSRKSEYSQQAYTTKQLNTVNNHAQLNNNRRTKYAEQRYAIQQTLNRTERDNWIQSITAHYWITDYSQLLDATGQVNTLNKLVQQWSQQPYRTGQLSKSTTVGRQRNLSHKAKQHGKQNNKVPLWNQTEEQLRQNIATSLIFGSLS